MKCNPLRWLWGLLPVALLSWAAVQVMHTDIEADLKARVDDQLKGSGFKWARTGFTGRDGLITGTATDDADPGRAYDIARSIWGVRVIDNKAELIDKVDTYEWSVVRNGNALKLVGHVPNDSVRADIVKAAKASFANAEVVDEMKLARGVPSPEAWLSGVNFGIKQIAGLKSGEARLSNLNLTVSGAAGDLKGYNAVKTALANDLPKGLKLVDDKVLAPTVKPFVWTANHNSNQVVLTGYVPGERARADILSAAKAAFPRDNVVDRMEIAEGAANGHTAAVVAVLKNLAMLEEGNAEIRDQALSLQGTAADDKIAETARQIKAVPSNFRVSEVVKARIVLPKPVSPFTTSAVVDTQSVTLTGYAPSEAARDQALQAVRSHFPGRRIENKLEIAAGAPQGWSRCLDGALTGVARVGIGKIALTDQRAEITGATDDEALAGALPQELKSALRADCDADIRIDVLAEAVPELVWRANYTGNEIHFDGDVSSAALKASLLATAGRLFPGKAVVDKMRVIETRTRKWPLAAEQGLLALADLQKGDANLTRQQLTVTGQAANAAQVSRIHDRLSSGLPKGYLSREQITVAVVAPQQPQPQPPPSPPKAVTPPPPPQKAVTPTPPPPPPKLSAAEAACQAALQSTVREGMIRFERASANLTRESFATLDKLASVLKTCPDVTVEIEGHTDSEGTPERNQGLSDRRANSVADYLERNGVLANKVHAVGYGETRPLVPNDTPENRAKNRRIEFTVKGK